MKEKSAIEGKEHMSFKNYQKTFKLLIEDGSMESIFTQYFLTMQLNSILWSEATENISFSQMIWKNDHLKRFFQNINQIKLV